MTPFRYFDLSTAREVVTGERVLARHDCGHRPLGNDGATVNSSAGPDVDHVVGGPDRIFVVFNHQHGISDISQVGQCPQ